MKKNIEGAIANLKKLTKDTPSHFMPIISFNIAVVAFQLIYTGLRFKYLNNVIPFWYTLPWGETQLADKTKIFLLPLFSLLIIAAGGLFSIYAKKNTLRYGDILTLLFSTVCVSLLTYSQLRIIFTASTPFAPIINPHLLKLFAPFSTAFLASYFLTPRFIKFAREKGLVTNPKIHEHPGMVLDKPSARGGGLVFTLSFLAISLLFVKLSPPIIGIMLSVALASIIGFLDDTQNTKPKSKLKVMENPILRFFLQCLAVLPILITGILIKFIGNPFDGIISFDVFKITFGGVEFAPIAILITLVWVVWLINLLSWSNGVDGQYSGIAGIASIVIAFLAIRLIPEGSHHLGTAKLAIISAGACFGLARYTWHPSKIMWGFGAISAGIIISATSILAGAKIATALVVILVPFLDGAITFARRVIQKRSPFKGDRGHLHHLLLERGWSVKRIAVFYWLSTAFCGAVGLLSSEKNFALTVLTLGGVAAFIIILLNLKSEVVRQLPQQPE